MIPALESLIEFVRKIQRDRIGGLAAEMAYFLLLALFPLLIVLFVMLSYIHVDYGALSVFLFRMLPHDIAQLVLGIVEEVTGNKNLALLSFGVLAAFWASLKGARSLILGVNVAYDAIRSRGVVKTYLTAIIATLGIPFIVVITLVFQVAGNSIASFFFRYLPNIQVIPWALNLLRDALPLASTGLYFFAFYKIAPNVSVRWRDILYGTVFAALAWYVASFFFSVYINHFANFSRFYGSIGSVIILMLWLHVTSTVILVGAQINAAVARHRKGRGAVRSQK